MQERQLWAITVTLPLRYSAAAEQMRFWNSAIENLRSLQQVQTATMTINSPRLLSGGDSLMGGIFPEGKEGSPRDGLTLSWRKVGAGYFSTIGMPR